jgi:hypothetical protein
VAVAVGVAADGVGVAVGVVVFGAAADGVGVGDGVAVGVAVGVAATPATSPPIGTVTLRWLPALSTRPTVTVSFPSG